MEYGKIYFDGLVWYDYLIFAVYNIIFSYVIFWAGDVYLKISRKSLYILIAIFQLYFILIVADSFLDFLPFMPDTELYSFMISSGQYPQDSSENIMSFYYLSLFIAPVCLNNPVIYSFLCICIYIIALMLFIKVWKDIYHISREAEYTFSILCLLWPAGMLYNTAPLREAFVLFGFALFINGLLRFMYEKKWKQLIAGSIIICFMRLQLAVLVMPVLGLLFVYKVKIPAFFKLVILCVCCIVALVIVRYIVVGNPISPQAMSELRNANLSKLSSMGYGRVEWQTYGDMFRDYPFIILQFLLAPLPIFIDHSPTDTLIALADVLFMLFLAAVLLISAGSVVKKYKPVLLFSLFFIILFGAYEYHLTGAVRHRMPLMLLFMLMASEPISKFVFHKIAHAKAEHSVVNH